MSSWDEQNKDGWLLPGAGELGYTINKTSKLCLCNMAPVHFYASLSVSIIKLSYLFTCIYQASVIFLWSAKQKAFDSFLLDWWGFIYLSVYLFIVHSYLCFSFLVSSEWFLQLCVFSPFINLLCHLVLQLLCYLNY